MAIALQFYCNDVSNTQYPCQIEYKQMCHLYHPLSNWVVESITPNYCNTGHSAYVIQILTMRSAESYSRDIYIERPIEYLPYSYIYYSTTGSELRYDTFQPHPVMSIYNYSITYFRPILWVMFYWQCKGNKKVLLVRSNHYGEVLCIRLSILGNSCYFSQCTIRGMNCIAHPIYVSIWKAPLLPRFAWR